MWKRTFLSKNIFKILVHLQKHKRSIIWKVPQPVNKDYCYLDLPSYVKMCYFYYFGGSRMEGCQQNKSTHKNSSNWIVVWIFVVTVDWTLWWFFRLCCAALTCVIKELLSLMCTFFCCRVIQGHWLIMRKHVVMEMLCVCVHGCILVLKHVYLWRLHSAQAWV